MKKVTKAEFDKYIRSMKRSFKVITKIRDDMESYQIGNGLQIQVPFIHHAAVTKYFINDDE